MANDASALGMDVVAFDPFISVNAAWSLSRDVKRAESIEDLFRNSDYITIHVPLTETTRGVFNKGKLCYYERWRSYFQLCTRGTSC